jgi:hypothetical protein
VSEAVTPSKFEPLGWGIFLAAHINFYFLMYTWQVFDCVQVNGDQARCLGLSCNERECGKPQDKIEKTDARECLHAPIYSLFLPEYFTVLSCVTWPCVIIHSKVLLYPNYNQIGWTLFVTDRLD